MPSCHSTNDIAADLIAKNEDCDGMLVVTGNQVKGRGQRGNSWDSAPNLNLTFSMILETPFLQASENFLLTIITSVALNDLLIECLDENVSIKWPNDLYHYDRKIAGMLIENYIKQDIIQKTIIGVGLNVNQKLFPIPTATSMFIATGVNYDLHELLERFLLNFESRFLELQNGERKWLRNHYLQRLYRLNVTAKYRAGLEEFEGIIRGIDEIGRLKVQRGSSMQVFDLKDIQFVFD